MLLMVFLVFGMLLNTPIIFAEENDSNSGNTGTSINASANVSTNSGSNENESEDEDDLNERGDDEDENESEDDEEKGNRDRVKIRSREIITKDNCTIKIEKELKTENGRTVEVIKRERVCADGTREEVKVRVESRTDDGRVRERIKYEFKGRELEVETEEGIELEENTSGTEYKLRARFRGNVTDIKIMPDVASQIAIERLRALNFTVELREVSSRGNVSKIVYHARAEKDGRFIGIFKLKVGVETQIDPETGEIIGTTKPWWAFFVAGEDSDQTGENTGEDAEEKNETNELIINLLEQNDSGESGTATLTEESGQVTVTISTTGFVENVSQPAHIHLGVCPDVGAVKYPLTNLLNGGSVTTINVTFGQLEDELPLAINVHKSAEEASVYVSCGNLEF